MAFAKSFLLDYFFIFVRLNSVLVHNYRFRATTTHEGVEALFIFLRCSYACVKLNNNSIIVSQHNVKSRDEIQEKIKWFCKS